MGAAAPGPTLSARTLPAASLAPTATSDVTPEGLAAPVCLGTEAWRIATVETWQLVIAGTIETQQVRVWRGLRPRAGARGPPGGRPPPPPVAPLVGGAPAWG